MRYALLLYLDPERARRTSADAAREELDTYAALTDELADAGMFVGGEALMPADTAEVVEVHDGRVETSPADRTSRELSGFYIVDCEAHQIRDIASRMPVAAHGAVEIRRVMPFPSPTTDERSGPMTP